MLQSKVLILKLLAIDRDSSCTIASCEITSLAHKRLYDAVEAGALVVEIDPIDFAFLACAKCAEVLGGLGNNWGSVC